MDQAEEMEIRNRERARKREEGRQADSERLTTDNGRAGRL